MAESGAATTRQVKARPPAAPDAQASVEWFAELLEPMAALAIRRGVRLPTLIDGLKLALVRAASEPDGSGAGAGSARSDSRVAVMTGVHRKDLRRIRTTGSTARAKGLSVAGEVFARWRSVPEFLTRRGRPRVLPRQATGDDRPSFESLVSGVTRDVHPRAVLDELLRLRLVAVGPADQVRLIESTFVPSADAGEMLAFARDNLADHCAAVAANLDGGGRRFLEQAMYSDELTAESARQFNRETLAAWEKVFSMLMPRLQGLHEADRHADAPRDHRVRLGMYGFDTVVRARR